MEEKDTIVTPDEAQAEQEALAVAKDDEIRADVVSSLGLEENDDNREFIEKLVAREKENRGKLSTAIRQKINWREKATKAPTPPAPNQPRTEQHQYDPDAVRKQTETTVRAELEQRDLDEMEYSDEIKADIKKLAQLQGVSVRKAAKDPYIQHRIEQAKAAERPLEAGVPRTPHAASARTEGQAPKFDMSTEEGRKAFKEWKTVIAASKELRDIVPQFHGRSKTRNLVRDAGDPVR